MGKPSVAQHGHPTWAPLATGLQAGAGVPGFHAAGVDGLIRVRPEPLGFSPHPVFAINFEWTAFSLSKIPSMTFFLADEQLIRTPGVQVAEGRLVERGRLHHAARNELIDHHLDETDLRWR